jgi:hypothetical protein
MARASGGIGNETYAMQNYRHGETRMRRGQLTELNDRYFYALLLRFTVRSLSLDFLQQQCPLWRKSCHFRFYYEQISNKALRLHNSSSRTITMEAIELKETMSPQARWPVIGTSVSGIAAETWEAFHMKAEKDGLTYRKAMEAAITDLAAAVRSGEKIEWPHATGGPKKPLQIHYQAHGEVKVIMALTKMRQNVVFLAAIERWTAKGA